MSVDPNQAKSVFLAAIEKAPEERAEFIAAQCGDDPPVFERVQALLEAHEQAEDVFSDPTAVNPPQLPGSSMRSADWPSAAAEERPGARIGPYKILQILGEGGFGVVYTAQQEEPFRRRVALKIIKLGMDTRQVTARFEAERQALAMMDHPNIAKVLDAGTTESGRPYFVMELVKGMPVTEYCDRESLTTKDRLKLFIQICHAVQHAHQKGVIHRDIKPGNVMVTLHDGAPVPKVIDFGIAKAISQRLTERTLFTEHGQFVGTPAYMSPEQAEMSGLDVDTRSDVYSLGVLLYELLTGSAPFDKKRLRSAGLAEIQRIIREEDPPKPSTRLNSLITTIESKGFGVDAIARQRRTDPTALRRLLRGELDWIVMKAMEKDRARRYDGAGYLAADLKRYLGHEPVIASPPSATYRLRKMLHRHRGPAAAAAIVTLALVLGIIGASVGLIRAVEEGQRAQEQADEATRQGEIARAVNDFLNKDLLAAVAPSIVEGRGRDVAMREVLDVAAASIEEASAPSGRFADKPLVEAGIRTALGTTYGKLGEYDIAKPHLRRARELTRDQCGEDSPPAIESALLFGDILRSLGEYDQAEELLLDAERSARALPEAHEELRIRARGDLGLLYYLQGRYDEAEARQKEARTRSRSILGPTHEYTRKSTRSLGLLLTALGRYEEAKELYSTALTDAMHNLGEAHPHTLTCANNLGMVLVHLDEVDEAQKLFIDALEMRRTVLGPGHPDTLTVLSNLAVVYEAQARYAEAEPLLREALAGRRIALSEDHGQTLESASNLSVLLARLGRFTEAHELALETLEGRQRTLGEDHPATIHAHNNLGSLSKRMGNLDDAEVHYVAAVAGYQRTLGDDHPDTLTARSNLAKLYAARWNLEAAERELREVLAGRQRVLPANHRSTLMALNDLGRTLLNQGRTDEAEKYLAEAWAGSRRALGDENPLTLIAKANHALALRDGGKLDQAEAALRETVESLRGIFADDHSTVLTAVNYHADVLELQENFEQSASMRRDVLSIHRAKEPPTKHGVHTALRALGRNLILQQRFAEAELALRECLAIREKALKPSDWHVADTRSALGECMTGQGNYAEAETALLEAWETLNPPPRHAEQKRRAAERLVALYDAWHEFDPGGAFEAQAAQWRQVLSGFTRAGDASSPVGD